LLGNREKEICHDLKQNHNLKVNIQPRFEINQFGIHAQPSIFTATTTIMNLVDLGDDELILLFQYVDHKTKLNLMLTCKRFENVIGSYLELFGKFKLTIREEHLESPDRVQTLTQMRRHFGRIQIFGDDVRLDTEAYNLVFQLLTKIGSKLVELVISCRKICFDSLVNLLKLTHNITMLYVSFMDITAQTDFNAQFKLKNLRRFEIRSSSNIDIFEKIFKHNSLYDIQIIIPRVSLDRNVPVDYWTVIPRILSKQENLVSLALYNCPIVNFPDSPEIWALKHLLELSLSSLKFPTPKDFENFTKFIKSLNKLTELSLRPLAYKKRNYIDEPKFEDDIKSNDLTEILTHLLFLPTLTKMTFNYFNWTQMEKFSKLKIQNGSVKDLTIIGMTEDDTEIFGKYLKIFPNVRKLSVTFSDEESSADLSLINSFTMLEELEVRDLMDEMLYQIKVKTLRCFKINTYWDVEPESCRYFCLNHPQLERLEVGGYGFENLFVENLPNLKTLILKPVNRRLVSEEETIKMIAENCTKLEYLEICVQKMKAETAVAVLKEKLPGLRGCVKQIERFNTLRIIKL
jgi:hypothetical protein